MEHRETSEVVFDGRLIRVRRDTVRLASGRIATREVVEHPGAVAILPVTAAGALLLVGQFRYAIGRTILEVPAGTREAGESPRETAQRELIEETGFRAGALEEMASFFVSPGWANEQIVLFRATSLERVGPVPDPDEILELTEVERAEIPGLMRDGKIADAKTVTAIMLHLSGRP